MSPAASSILTFNKESPFYNPPSAFQESSLSGELPLSSKWQLWEQQQQVRKPSENEHSSNATYHDSTVPTQAFQTAQEFWKIFDAYPQPSEILTGKKQATSFMIFRDAIRPEWEDPINRQGGHFQFNLQLPSNHDDRSLAFVDEYWNNIVLAVVGNSFDMAEYVTGIRLVNKSVSSKPHLRIEIWFKQCDKTDLLKKTFEILMKTSLDGVVAREFISPIRLDIRGHDDGSIAKIVKKKDAPVEKSAPAPVEQHQEL
jgi:translation initiation factor 4E